MTWQITTTTQQWWYWEWNTADWLGQNNPPSIQKMADCTLYWCNTLEVPVACIFTVQAPQPTSRSDKCSHKDVIPHWLPNMKMKNCVCWNEQLRLWVFSNQFCLSRCETCQSNSGMYHTTRPRPPKNLKTKQNYMSYVSYISCILVFPH